jgi:serine protease
VSTPQPPISASAPRRAIAAACLVLALALAAPATLALSQPTHAAGGAGPVTPGGPGTSIAAPRATGGPAPAAPAGGGGGGGGGPSDFAPYAPGVVVVDYAASTGGRAPVVRAAVARIAGEGAGASAGEEPAAAESESHTQLVTLRPGADVPAAVARLRRQRGVAWAAPDYLAHASVLPVAGSTAPTVAAAPPASSALVASASSLPTPAASLPPTAAAGGPSAFASAPFPDDPGTAGVPGGWSQLQWNFVGTFGVDAPRAWDNLIADHAPGGRGVIVAVLDTGVAYANRGRFRRSPDFYPYQFVKGYDFVAHDPYPDDRNGHGTDVAGTIAEATDNGIGLTGLAYGVRIMPVRVLDSEGNGDASTIAKGVRFAVRHGAQVINLSLEFPIGVTATDIPELISALRYAHRHRVVVVAAAGNEAHAAAAYPARAPAVIAVGATTEHGCLASYSNFGTGLTLVAPGGGPDADLPGDPNCHPELPPGRDVYQVTFTGSSPRRFGIPSDYEGTSMAAPHVAATAALIIASRVLGRHPTPAQIVARLRATARPLGGPGDRQLYGAGLVDAAAATAPGGPGAVAGGG